MEILYIILVIISLEFLLDLFLEYLNLNSQKPILPEPLQNLIEPDTYNKSIAYNKEVTRFGLFTSTLSFIVTFILLISGTFGAIDEWMRQLISHEILLSLAYFGFIYLISDILTIPFQLYSLFVIEEKFGFNKTSTRTFVADKIKGYLLAIIFGGAIGFIFLWLVMTLGQSFWIYFLIVITIFMLLLNMFYASLIVPLFNKLTPLNEGSLKEKIKSYSSSVSFPLQNVFVIDGSKRSNKSNAFFSGVGKKKKIVLYDTLINNHSEEELVAILAHEVGHFKKKHILGSYILSILNIGIMLYLLSLMIFNPALSSALGGNQLSIHLNILVFGMLYAPISKVIGVMMNWISRKNEFEADAYATATYNGGALQEALKKLSVNNLSNFFPHKWYVIFHYSHPPLIQRLEAINKAS
ncbi:MAG: M48 family metallopeptidase [Bacteroidota bacterium]|nr:M48 family metallopeptidase [Bacteroidota bacterium]